MEKILKYKYFRIGITITLIGVLVLGVRFAVTYPYPIEFFGYDFGFYSYAVQHTHLSSLLYFLGLRTEYGTHLFVILNWLRLPQVPTLIFLYYTFQISSGIVLWFILRRHSKAAAWLGVIFFALSISQTKMHSMFLWKAAYGQLLMLLIIYLLDIKKWYLASISSILLLIAHKTTIIIFGLSFITSSLIQYQNKKIIKYSFVFAVILICASMVWNFSNPNYFQSLFSSTEASIEHGIFLSIKNYFTYSWLILLLAIFGIYKYRKDPNSIIWLSILGVSIFWIIAKLPFYNRILQYADLAIIYFAATGTTSIKSAWLNTTAKKITTLCLIVIITLLQLINFKHTIEPLISQVEVNEIGEFANEHPGAFLLSINSTDAPWLLAYLHGNIRLAAPGLYENLHTIEQWKRFWQNPTNQDFLNSYPDPLYIYDRSGPQITGNEKCFERISPNIIKNLCHN